MNIPIKNLIMLSVGIIAFSIALNTESGLLGAASGLLIGTAFRTK